MVAAGLLPAVSDDLSAKNCSGTSVGPTISRVKNHKPLPLRRVGYTHRYRHLVFDHQIAFLVRRIEDQTLSYKELIADGPRAKRDRVTT